MSTASHAVRSTLSSCAVEFALQRQGLGFRVEGLGFGAEVLGFGVEGWESRVESLGFRV